MMAHEPVSVFEMAEKGAGLIPKAVISAEEMDVFVADLEAVSHMLIHIQSYEGIPRAQQVALIEGALRLLVQPSCLLSVWRDALVEIEQQKLTIKSS